MHTHINSQQRSREKHTLSPIAHIFLSLILTLRPLLPTTLLSDPPQPSPKPLIPTNSPTPRKYASLDTPPTPRRAFCCTSSLYQEQSPRKVSAPKLKPFPSYSPITTRTTGSVPSWFPVPSVRSDPSYSASHPPERSRYLRSGSQTDLIQI